MLLLAIMWGLSIPVTKLGLGTMPPLTLTALRFAVAVPLLFFLGGGKTASLRGGKTAASVARISAHSRDWSPRHWRGPGHANPGVVGTSASVGTIISATIPVFVVIFAALRLKQAVSGRQALGLLAAFVGIALVASGNGREAPTASETTMAGVGLMLLSALAVAFYYVWSVELANMYGTATLAEWSTFFGFVALLPWASWEMWRIPFHVTAEAVGAAVYLGVVVTVAGLFLWLHLLRTVPARTAAGVQYLQPVVGIAASSAMFGDKLGFLFVAGVILILGGLALSMTSRAKARIPN